MDKAKAAKNAVRYAKDMTLKGKGIKPSEEYNPYLYPPYPKFSEMMAAVVSGYNDPHVVPASHKCGPCGEKSPDFLIKAESFECDLNNMFALTNNSRLTVSSLPKYFKILSSAQF